MKVYLNDPIDPASRDRLARQVEIIDNFDAPEELDAIIVRQQYCPREVIARAKKCRLIQMHGTGLERIDLAAAKEYGIPVQNTPGANSRSVAELALGMMLSLARKVPYVDARVRRGEITSFGRADTVGTELTGKTLGLVCWGHVAQHLAAMVKAAFGMRVLCWSRHCSAEELAGYGVEKADSLQQLVSSCDFVSIHCTSAPEFHHLFGRELLAACSPRLILINTARGGIVDEAALYDALRAGQLRAAGLDVFEEQPPRADNPLFTLENFIGTMHIGGSTDDALARNGKLVVDAVLGALLLTE